MKLKPYINEFARKRIAPNGPPYTMEQLSTINVCVTFVANFLDKLNRDNHFITIPISEYSILKEQAERYKGESK